MITTQKKIDRALYGPSLVEVTLGAVLSLALGAFLGALFLMLKPVQKVNSVPAEPEARQVYYVEGSQNSAKGRQYLRKRQLFMEGSVESIALSEEELNTWIASSRANPDTREPAGLLAPRSINFRIRDGVFQIGVPTTFGLFGLDESVVIQVRGSFEQSEDGVNFAPQEMYIGSLAAHRIPGLTTLALNSLLSGQEISPDLIEAWTRLKNATVQEDHLVLSF